MSNYKTELLPCAFCGSEALHYDNAYATCGKYRCPLNGVVVKNESWNTRAAPAEDVRAVVEEPVAWMSECIRGYKKGVIQQTDGPGSTNNIEYWTPDFPVYRRPQRPVANLKRYDWARDDGMVEDATGEYVLWSDLERLNK